MDGQEVLRVYPRFILGGDGIFPAINLPANFRELVPKFYAGGGREHVEQYVDELAKILEKSQRLNNFRLNWTETEGLRNISIGVHGGLDLEDSSWPHFQTHNLGWHNGFYAAFVAIEYVRELLRHAEK